MTKKIKALKNLLDWKLLDGSHEWPGPDGGTCINEAAIVIAGFEYREVQGLEDIPRCFSKPLAAMLIELNDNLDNKARQSLIPFATRLAGSVDCVAVERKRMTHMIKYVKKVTQQRDWDEYLYLISSLEPMKRKENIVTNGTAAGETLSRILCPGIYRANIRLLNETLSVLHEAFDIGNQASPIEEATIVERVKLIKETVPAE